MTEREGITMLLGHPRITNAFPRPRYTFWLRDPATGEFTKPNAFGLVYSYEAGSTTPKPLYQDKELTVVMIHPITLDRQGSAEFFPGDSPYCLHVQDAEGNTTEIRDNLERRRY